MKSNSGIYKIINIINNKIYIGSTVNFKRRKRNHFWDLNNNKHDNDYLQKAYNKYGKENFRFEIIEYIEDKKILLEREQSWIDKLNVCDRNIGYNICEVAGNTLGQKMSSKTKQKISNSVKEYFKSNNNPFLGKKHSEETRKIISTQNSIPIININTGEIFKSIICAANKYKVSSTAICNTLKGKTKMSCGYKWQYLEDYNKEQKKPND